MTAMKQSDADEASIAHIVQNLRDNDRRELLATSFLDDPLEIARHYGQERFAWVFGLERPIAYMGASARWPGMWCPFMLATDEFGQIGLSLTKWAVRVMIPSLDRMGARRLEAVSMADHHTAHRWMGFFGMKPEARLRQFGKGGEDFILFGWSRGDRYHQRRVGHA